MRCFLAIPLREPALAAAQATLAGLRERLDAVRWARPETLHLTVHFFGSIDDAEREAALTALAPVVEQTRAFTVTLDTLGAFPNRRSPRVLWLGSARESSELAAFASRCRNALSAGGFAVDARPFRAHCTLGRPRTPWPVTAHTVWAEVAGAPYRASAFDADRVVMYQSLPGRGGAVYTPLTILSLQPQAAARR